jgi:hypothetical protein
VVQHTQYNVTQPSLDFQVQLTDATGSAVLQGGKEVTMRVTGPTGTTTSTLVTSPNGTVTSKNTAKGIPVAAELPGTYRVTFSAAGIKPVTDVVYVDLNMILLKRLLTNRTIVSALAH